MGNTQPKLTPKELAR